MPLYYECLGSGANLVMLHGWGWDSRSLHPLAIQLSQQYRVILIDLPGFGQSNPVENYSLQTILDVVLEVCPRSFYLIGWSFGGLVALAIQQQFPERVIKLCLLSCSPCFVAKDNWPGISPEQVQKLITDIEINRYQALKKFVFFILEKNQNKKNYLQYVNFLKNNTPLKSTLCSSLNLLINLDFRDALNKKIKPILFIFAANDNIVPAIIAKNITHLNDQIKTVTIDAAAHLFIFSHNKELTEHIMSFYEEN